MFFGRDAQVLRGLDVVRGMRTSGVESLFVILGPSGAGKSSFLRAGLLPRLRRDDRCFLPMPIVRPEQAVLTGEFGLARAIQRLRTGLSLRGPLLGEVKNACRPEHVEQVRGWLAEAREAARARLLDVPAEQPAPTLVLPVDQAEELFHGDAGPEAARFLELLANLVEHEAGVTPAMIVALTIRADRYEPLAWPRSWCRWSASSTPSIPQCQRSCGQSCARSTDRSRRMRRRMSSQTVSTREDGYDPAEPAQADEDCWIPRAGRD